MAEDSAVTVYNSSAITDTKKNPFLIKVGMAQMLRGGAILEVTAVEQAKLAKDAKACAIVVSKPESCHRGDGISRCPTPPLSRRSSGPSPSPSWRDPESVTSSKCRFLKPLTSITSTRVRLWPWPTRRISSTSIISELHLSAGVAISARS